MAKKKNKGKKTQSKKVAKEEDSITWDDVAAMSDSDDEKGVNNALESNAKAKNLKQSIEKNINSMLALLKKTEGDDEDEFEEDDLEGSSSEGDDEVEDEEKAEQSKSDPKHDSGSDKEEKEDENNDGQKELSFIEQIKNKASADEDGDSDSDSGSSDDENGEDDKKKQKYMKVKDNNNMNSKALLVVATELNSIQSKMPWPETFVIVPPTPLPFGENGDPEQNPLDIHDDLKREVAFYNSALEAVNLARPKLKDANISLRRPDDFFAEMVKTDDHMAGVKDRLIFENKKMEAVSQRKSNKEQLLRAKESHANRLAEKSKRKRDHFQEVEDWANSAAKNRGGALRDDVDDYYLNKNNRYNGTGPSNKRQNSDKKFGFGGKNGRFKQNDRKSMNDMSGFNPRGNFAGGMKKAKGGAGANRSGKRARDSKRAQR